MRDIVNVQPDGSLRPATPGSVFREIAATYVSPPVYRRDYSKVLAPALFVFPATWLPTGFADPELRRKAAEWHEQRYRPWCCRTEQGIGYACQGDVPAIGAGRPRRAKLG